MCLLAPPDLVVAELENVGQSSRDGFEQEDRTEQQQGNRTGLDTGLKTAQPPAATPMNPSKAETTRHSVPITVDLAGLFANGLLGGPPGILIVRLKGHPFTTNGVNNRTISPATKQVTVPMIKLSRFL